MNGSKIAPTVAGPTRQRARVRGNICEYQNGGNICDDEKGKQAWEPIPVVLAGAAVTEITPKEETKPRGRVRATRDKKQEAGNG